MKKVGIITYHKITNYGSVLQAYALQRACELLGYSAEIIDYLYPNSFQKAKPANIEPDCLLTPKQKFIKYLYAPQILLHHKRIADFVKKYHRLTPVEYVSPEHLLKESPKYDIYVSGSDQLWNTHFSKGDPSFLLHFAPTGAKKISYATSLGSSGFNNEYLTDFQKGLSEYSSISVREEAGISIVKSIIGKDAKVVLDPTLLLNSTEWNKVATPKRIEKKPYILCYFLNYTFDAYPYVDILADHIQKLTGYKLVMVGKPPKKFYGRNVRIIAEASPENFLALFRDAEMVLTTSFHGTAFSVNYGKPFITVVDNKTKDSRVVNFLKLFGLDNQKINMNDELSSLDKFHYSLDDLKNRLSYLREDSLSFLKKSLDE